MGSFALCPTQKIARKIHTSKKRVIQDFSFYSQMILNDSKVADDFELDSDEIAFCKKISI